MGFSFGPLLLAIQQLRHAFKIIQMLEMGGRSGDMHAPQAKTSLSLTHINVYSLSFPPSALVLFLIRGDGKSEAFARHNGEQR